MIIGSTTKNTEDSVWLVKTILMSVPGFVFLSLADGME